MEPTDCRLHFPGAILHFTSRYLKELDDFYERDEEAAELYDALLRSAVRDGLSLEENKELRQRRSEEATHRAPVGRGAFRRRRPRVSPVPWLGELTVYGSDATDDRGPFWRGYFSDLREVSDRYLEIDDVLMASIRMKGGAKGVRRGEQDKHLTDAGEAVIEWCRSHGNFTFRVQD